ncbi:hypothetical protein FRX31_014677, partial [Thalictrum thalictroides]
YPSDADKHLLARHTCLSTNQDLTDSTVLRRIGEVLAYCLAYKSLLQGIGKLQDVTAKILDHMDGRPDLVIGNYIDGNLVAYLMASRLKITHVCIVFINSKF